MRRHTALLVLLLLPALALAQAPDEPPPEEPPPLPAEPPPPPPIDPDAPVELLPPQPEPEPRHLLPHERARRLHEERLRREEERRRALERRRAAREAEHQAYRLFQEESLLGPAGISRARLSSGTAWQTDSAPIHGWVVPFGRGGLLFKGNVFAGYSYFLGARGSDEFFSTNHVDALSWLDLGPFEFALRGMLSAEPFTVGDDGYPLPLQTGGTLEGQPLVDRQHPNDLFVELAGTVTLSLGKGFALFAYVAAAGEPALGPVSYTHRISAISDPLAPIGHGWQDAAHTSSPVLTVGAFTRYLKLEGSWFNGREPDENHFDLDLRLPDSWSARATFNPGETWSFQASYGYLKSPSALDPGPVHRVSASATHLLGSSDLFRWATTFAYGHNIPVSGLSTLSFLMEHTFSVLDRHVVFFRGEYATRTGAQLALGEGDRSGRRHLGDLGLGYLHYFGPFASIQPGVGVRGTLGIVEDTLEPYYGTRFPAGITVFLQLRPAALEVGAERREQRPRPFEPPPPEGATY